MIRTPPGLVMDIPVPLEVYQQLTSAACRAGFEKENWEIAAQAIDEWMRRHDPESLSTPATSGYQWKRLFLPTGTLLRTVFKGKNYHCLVEGDDILYDGKAVSPSGFVNAVGGVRRNAWESTWILFPGAKQWKLANPLRTRHPPSRPRSQGAAVQSSLGSARRAATSQPQDAAPAHEPQVPVQAAADARPSDDGDRRPVAQADRSIAPRERNRRALTDTSPHARERPRDRRSNGRDDMITLLCHELIPLLHRFSAQASAHSAVPSPPGG